MSFKIGDRVYHEKMGVGEVVDVRGLAPYVLFDGVAGKERGAVHNFLNGSLWRLPKDGGKEAGQATQADHG